MSLTRTDIDIIKGWAHRIDDLIKKALKALAADKKEEALDAIGGATDDKYMILSALPDIAINSREKIRFYFLYTLFNGIFEQTGLVHKLFDGVGDPDEVILRLEEYLDRLWELRNKSWDEDDDHEIEDALDKIIRFVEARIAEAKAIKKGEKPGISPSPALNVVIDFLDLVGEPDILGSYWLQLTVIDDYLNWAASAIRGGDNAKAARDLNGAERNKDHFLEALGKTIVRRASSLPPPDEDPGRLDVPPIPPNYG
jgi:hypothetical protein